MIQSIHPPIHPIHSSNPFIYSFTRPFIYVLFHPSIHKAALTFYQTVNLAENLTNGGSKQINSTGNEMIPRSQPPKPSTSGTGTNRRIPNLPEGRSSNVAKFPTTSETSTAGHTARTINVKAIGRADFRSGGKTTAGRRRVDFLKVIYYLNHLRVVFTDQDRITINV